MRRRELLILVPGDTTQDQLKKLEQVVGHPIESDYPYGDQGNRDVMFCVPEGEIKRLEAALEKLRFLKITWVVDDEIHDDEEEPLILLRLDSYSRAAQACQSKTQLQAQLRKHRATLTKPGGGKVDYKSWAAREARKHIAALKQVMQSRGIEFPPGPEPNEKLQDLLRLFPEP